MKNAFGSKKRGRKRSVSFNPDSQYIRTAVDEFLKGGGKINQVVADEKSFENTWMNLDVSSEVDDFLIGQ